MPSDKADDVHAVVVDTVIRHATIVDGVTNNPFVGDVAILDSRIVAVGSNIPQQGHTEIDANSLTLFPGFVDSHVHADAQVFRPETQLALLSQGVTTVILGQDGVSFAPGGRSAADFADRYFRPLNGPLPPELRGADSVASLLDSYDRSVRVNVAYLVPAGTVRFAVMGWSNRAATADELVSMTELVSEGVTDGAVGVSTGLDYLPGKYASLSELATLLSPLRDGGVYVTHMRGYEARAWEGISEIRGLAPRARIPVHISHLHGPAKEILPLLDDLGRVGVDVTFDSYPYTRGATMLSIFALPAWIGHGPLSVHEELQLDHVRRALVDDWFPSQETRLSSLVLSHIGDAKFDWAQGLQIGTAAESAGVSVADFIYRILVENELDVGCVTSDTWTSHEEDLQALIRDPRHMASSDGIFIGGTPHPRGWGSFSRFLGRYTRDLGDWSLPEAVRHLSTHAVDRFRLGARGRIVVGCEADLVLADLPAIASPASYSSPRQLSQGVRMVFVGGLRVYDGDRLSDQTPGRALLRQD